MNDRFFVCTDCKTYVNACGRWCRAALEHPGTVKWKQPVDLDRVLADARYWDETDPAFDGWRTKLVEARKFLLAHRGHHVIFLTDNDLDAMGTGELLHWLEVGSAPRWTPRYFAETLGMRRWADVERYIDEYPEAALALSGAWWLMFLSEDEWADFRREFERLVSPGT